ncbi:MAG: methyl-accepting chemotaxis protein [Gammaproteobacteria bacterium]|nr:methyl-accepting chemotaxis protein [Gammaproteobacteria bacterium]
MATKTDNSSLFNGVAALIALLLVTAAVLIYMQAGSREGGPSGNELAALSQAIPSQAARALSGEVAAFEQLDSSTKKVAALRRNNAPGSPSDWQRLESGAAAILAGRSQVEAVRNAADQIGIQAAAILEVSNELLDRSGATAVMQEFQQRAERIRVAGERLPAAEDGAASAIASDVAFLQSVAGALAGEPSDLDISPLNNEGREVALVPIIGSIAGLEEQSAVLDANLNQVNELAGTAAALVTSANNLLGPVSAGGENLSGGFLDLPWLPIGAVILATLLLGGLLALHSKTSVFENAAKEQAAQNDRNQQAILRLLDEMGSLADGDLTVEATVTEDITGTIADSFNFAIEELRKLVATVNDTALMVDTATKQTENTAAHLAKAADNQGQEINAATESIVSMAASIEEVSGNAERSSDVARHSVEVAHKGGEAVRRTIDGMNTIRETIQETSKRIKRLGESSQEIGNIIELINDIAEQTNILALNASIQASMAGEAGRGFAVVADEVQRLAERSTNATKQIEVLVRTIQSDTNEAVVSMERSTTDVVGGALLAENAGAALDEIEQVSNQIASLVQNISSSARQQAGSAADVTRRTTRLREIGDQTGQATSATAAAIAKLSELATQLRKTVEGFTLPAEMMQASALARTTSNAPPPATPAEAQAKAG